MPKGRGSNERRRNRRLVDRRLRSDEKAQAVMDRGHAKLVALFERAQKVQKARRKAAKKKLKAART
jgi:hypothetical protein